MAAAAALARVRSEQSGFTLVELLVVLLISMVVVIALFTFQDVVLRQSTRVFAEVDATQRARNTVESIENQLHSACMAENVVPIRDGSTGTSLTFVSKFGSAASLTPVKHTIAWTGATTQTLTDSSYAVTGGSSPNWTFSSTPSSTRTLLDHVQQVGSTPIFRYYKYGIAADASGSPVPRRRREPVHDPARRDRNPAERLDHQHRRQRPGEHDPLQLGERPQPPGGAADDGARLGSIGLRGDDHDAGGRRGQARRQHDDLEPGHGPGLRHPAPHAGPERGQPADGAAMRMIWRRRATAEDGFTMIVALMVLTISTLMVAGAFVAANGDIGNTQRSLDGKKAYYAARAGMAAFLSQVNRNTELWQNCPSRATTQVPGAPSNVRYAYVPVPANGASTCSTTNPVGSMIDFATGSFRMRFTGTVSNSAGQTVATRDIVASFRRDSPLDFLWYSVYETLDPNTYADPASKQDCAEFRRDGRPSDCGTISWITGDKLNGPMYTQDQYSICGSPTFGRPGGTDNVLTAAPGPPTAPGMIPTSGCSNNAIVNGDLIENAPYITAPPDNSNLLTYATQDGVVYTGATDIALNGNTATVSVRGGAAQTVDLVNDPIIYVKSGTCAATYSPYFSQSANVYDKTLDLRQRLRPRHLFGPGDDCRCQRHHHRRLGDHQPDRPGGDGHGRQQLHPHHARGHDSFGHHPGPVRVGRQRPRPEPDQPADRRRGAGAQPLVHRRQLRLRSADRRHAAQRAA